MAISTVKVNDHHQLLLEKHLQRFLGKLEQDTLALLYDRLEWIEIAGGDLLIKQGDPGTSMYICVSGRLRVYIDDSQGTALPIREMGRGEVFGEMSLYTDAPRSASVTAIRDSIIVKLNKNHFNEVLASSPQLGAALTRVIINRLQTQHERNTNPLPVTITFVPITADVDSADIAEKLAKQLRKLGSVTVVNEAVVKNHLNSTVSSSATIAEIKQQIAIYLDNVESKSDFVLFLADDSPTEWTQTCCRHGDEILLLANALQPPKLHITETDYLDKIAQRTEASEVLILLHPTDAQSPKGTNAWLNRRPVANHIHIRPNLEKDIERLARIETRTAVGLVLAGGGARGFAHLGVFKALKEHGTEVDFVGGTSMGAIMAALIAADQPLDKTFDVCRRAFLKNPTGDINWIPFISLISGRRLKATIIQSFNELLGHSANTEDLWKNYYCVATNYSKAREQVIRQGSLASSLRASAAIPGALPPILLNGDMLCDGATLNNFPVDIMRTTRGVGTVIGVDLNFKAPRALPFDEVPSTWALFCDKLKKRHKRRYKLPSLASYLMNVSILYSMSRREEAKNLTDIYFNPTLKRVGLLDWSRFDQTVNQGYEHALTVLNKQENS